jgi:hypothetical protein
MYDVSSRYRGILLTWIFPDLRYQLHYGNTQLGVLAHLRRRNFYQRRDGHQGRYLCWNSDRTVNVWIYGQLDWSKAHVWNRAYYYSRGNPSTILDRVIDRSE